MFAFSVLARELVPRATAACAVLIFVLDPARIVPIGWLANRAALICTLFGILAMYTHLRWREHGLRFGPITSSALRKLITCQLTGNPFISAINGLSGRTAI